jgi:pimeloyl-ACP methyl ester carboxylesterase
MASRSGHAQSRQARIFYEEAGEGRPVLFCHAGVADLRMWDAQFAAPVPGHRYVRSDMRGYGLSEWVAEPYSPTTDVEAVVDHLTLEDLVLVGCSMGGRIAMEIAVRRPETVSALVIIGSGTPGWEPPDGFYEPPQYEGSEQIFKEGRWDEAAHLDAEVWGVGVGREWEDTDADFLERMMEMDRVPVQTEYERDEYNEWAEENMLERVGEISVPTLVVVGEHDLPHVVTATADLATRISDRPRVLIEASAHLPSMERPEVFNPIFEEFLRSI